MRVPSKRFECNNTNAIRPNAIWLNRLQHSVYASPQTRQIRCEEQYASWMETVCTLDISGYVCTEGQHGNLWNIVMTVTYSGKSIVEMALDASGIHLEDEIIGDDCSTYLRDLSLSVSSEEAQGGDSVDLTFDNLSINSEVSLAENSPFNHDMPETVDGNSHKAEKSIYQHCGL